MRKKVYLFLACDSPEKASCRFFSVLVPVYLFAIEIPPMSIKINFALRRPYILKYNSFFEKNK